MTRIALKHQNKEVNRDKKRDDTNNEMRRNSHRKRANTNKKDDTKKERRSNKHKERARKTWCVGRHEKRETFVSSRVCVCVCVCVRVCVCVVSV
jgi:hypothetical protein